MRTKLTKSQKRIAVREMEFSVHFSLQNVIKAFPSVTFIKGMNNGGVTWVYSLTGPVVWLDKIERKYAYPV